MDSLRRSYRTLELLESWTMLEFILLLISPPQDFTPVVGVTAAYSVRQDGGGGVTECCGECTNGKIIHGDGHVTDCPCPETCECKADKALLHESVTLGMDQLPSTEETEKDEPQEQNTVTTKGCVDGSCRVYTRRR